MQWKSSIANVNLRLGEPEHEDAENGNSQQNLVTPTIQRLVIITIDVC
jgi:hypothetical protein